MLLWYFILFVCSLSVFFFQAEDGIRDLVRSRGLGDVYKRQVNEEFINSFGIEDGNLETLRKEIRNNLERELKQALSLIHI